MEPQHVTRRRVFYLPGYDPIHPRRYRELYRSEGARQAGISGYALSLRAGAPSSAAYGWKVTADIEGARVETRFEVLAWSDLVRSSMATGIGATYLQLFRTAWIYIGSGALRRLMRLRAGPVVAALYPIVMLLTQLAIALCVAGIVGWGLWQIAPASAPLAAASVPWVLAGFRGLDGKLYAYYLMHDYAHTAQNAGAMPDDLAARIETFRAGIAAALAEDVDEVLIVGHSSGAHLGVSLLAGLIRADQIPEHGPALGFLTLGQVVPMVSFLPEAYELRADLQLVSESAALAWIDVTAPGDGCAFALCDPVAVTGVATPAQRWPVVFSAAFSKTLSAERLRALRHRYFQLHFQYLCAFDRPGAYDYFRITAGPQTLAARFATRRPSRSRITRAASKYTNLAA